MLSSDFIELRVELVPQTWRFETFDEVFDAISNETVRISGTLRAQTPAVFESIREHVRKKVEAYKHDGMIELPMSAVVAYGMKG